MPSAPSLFGRLVPLTVAVASAIALLGWGRLRGGGRSVLPTCRRCGYDVSHRPVGVDRCSECGNDLSRPAAIRTTAARVRWAVAVPSVAVGATAAVLCTTAAIRFPWRWQFAERAPLPWVVAAAARFDQSDSGDVYRGAWDRRGPSPGLYHHLLDVAAVRRPALDNLALSLAFLDGKLTPDRSDRFARLHFVRPVTFRVRSPVRLGDPLCVRLNSLDVPAYADGQLQLAAKAGGRAPLATDDD